MTRYSLCFASAAALTLAACSAPTDPVEASATATAANAAADAPAAPSPPAQAVSPAPATPLPPPPERSDPRINDGYPDLSPPALTPEAERGETGARNVLISFGRALELQEWDQAWALLSAADRTKWPKPQWAANFADLTGIMVAMPTGTLEGAAGSSYYTAPVTITATDIDGRPVRYEGEAVLRRVNDVDGATPQQRRWRFERLTLDWTH